ncbi:MAG: hypothetical protein IT267_03395 [Saprospiraceae bacterium]|nr:hypothetical protein [Saprospiraceae bacterium]
MHSFFSYNSTVEANNLRGRMISAILHLLLLLIFFFFNFEVKPPEDPDAPPYVSLVQFIPAPEMVEYENGGGSKGKEGLETKEGGSQGESKETPTPQPTEESKVKDVPIEELPKPSTPAPKPVVTSEPDVVTLPSPPKVPPVSKPSENNTSTTNTPTNPIPSTPTRPTNSGSNGDDDTPGSGGSGTGSGSGQGSGDAGTGSGTGAGGGSGTGGGGGTGGGQGSGTGTGTGDGVGVDFESTGPLKRKRDVCSISPGTLAGNVVQEVAFNICINRAGNITYINYNSKASKTRDVKFVKNAMNVQRSCRYQPNPSAPFKECGVVFFKVGANIQRIN